MLIVTGGTGFIGSNLIRHLNQAGASDILVVDDVDPKWRADNLKGCKFTDFVHKDELRAAIIRGDWRFPPVDAILHQGACADTMEPDEEALVQTNFIYSKLLLDWAVRHKTSFIYASSAAVYGLSQHCAEEPSNEKPLNIYARSKWMFDCHVRKVIESVGTTVVGLRYFNVYGRNESHKGRMASIVHQLRDQLLTDGAARLFGASHGYAAGEQRRDFVLADDVAKVNIFFLDGPVRRGIFNVATGTSRTFNEVAKILISLCGTGHIEYLPFPHCLDGKYQSFTQADLASLRGAGYACEFTPLEEGIQRSFFGTGGA